MIELKIAILLAVMGALLLGLRIGVAPATDK
ncbi:hypothetical protein ABIF63_002891 [Bradyrhizobium japonicum]|uniref:Uncharacterized protein n=1 Tax=Bradyrhizobium japonicum TaxID=375 RepID=A0ABV2RQC5_BRAJP|nr:hypothetical protein [Bradyrhizobium japonicum]MCS3533794.1 hypothetical protein [Bradyrhizobium japonicum]MCS3961810.1 hypothetical protein [Bradyrhizobium japonicum]MCS3990112.1 hypothetical protein [Bradyrhizobium japonicum]MCS3994127.1 hypothetical protein [Bradyrhizobium japonicum]